MCSFVHILASKSVPFTLTTGQVPNLALTHKKRITVQRLYPTILAEVTTIFNPGRGMEGLTGNFSTLLFYQGHYLPRGLTSQF
jgi:hypothetical protein